MNMFLTTPLYHMKKIVIQTDYPVNICETYVVSEDTTLNLVADRFKKQYGYTGLINGMTKRETKDCTYITLETGVNVFFKAGYDHIKNADIQKYGLLAIEVSSEAWSRIPAAVHRLLVKVVSKRKDGLNVKLEKFIQLSIGAGPTIAQQYYALLDDGTAHPFYQQDGLLEYLLTKAPDYAYEDIRGRTKWKKLAPEKEEQCVVCLDAPVERISSCLHCCSCKLCSMKLKECPLCRNAGNYYPIKLLDKIDMKEDGYLSSYND